MEFFISDRFISKETIYHYPKIRKNPNSHHKEEEVETNFQKNYRFGDFFSYFTL